MISNPRHSGRSDPAISQPLLSSNAGDAGTLAALVTIGLVVLTIAWLMRGGMTDRLIEIDEAGPLPYRFSIDINSADWIELCQLPEVGETLAQRIVEYRAAHGPFPSHAALRNVRGIGVKTLAKFQQYLRPIP